MKKLLDSDWLRAVQFKRNTSANHTSKFYIVISWKRIKNLLSQWYHVEWRRELSADTEKSFLEGEKMASRKIFRHTLHASVFMFILVIIRFSSFNLELICTCEFFKKLKLHSPKRLVQLQLFEKLARSNYFQIELETVWSPIHLYSNSLWVSVCSSEGTVKLEMRES